MELDGRRHIVRVVTALLAGLLVLMAAWQLDETFSAVKYWWGVAHAAPSEYVVPHWATLYTWASALFAPFWLALSCGTLILLRRRPVFAMIVMAAYLVAAPISCASAPSLYEQAGGFFALEELPFADAERAADLRHLIRVDDRIKAWGDARGEFPMSQRALRDAVGDLAYEGSPYEQAGRRIRFNLEFEIDEGMPYSTKPKGPGIVYYSVNPDGTQFVLTISGLNAPMSSRASMMRAGAFVGGKQPWGGLLASQENLHRR